MARKNPKDNAKRAGAPAVSDLKARKDPRGGAIISLVDQPSVRGPGGS